MAKERQILLGCGFYCLIDGFLSMLYYRNEPIENQILRIIRMAIGVFAVTTSLAG